MLELHIGRTGWDGEADRGDQFARMQCRLVDSGKEIGPRNLALIGMHRSPQRHDGGRVASGRVGVCNRAAQSALVTDHLIADVTCQIGQRGNGLAHYLRGGNLRMLGHGPDHHRAVVEMNTV